MPSSPLSARALKGHIRPLKSIFTNCCDKDQRRLVESEQQRDAEHRSGNDVGEHREGIDDRGDEVAPPRRQIGDEHPEQDDDADGDADRDHLPLDRLVPDEAACEVQSKTRIMELG